MIPTKKQTLEVTSNLEGQVVGMTIDENSLHHIMAVLTDLYSDPETAVIREYSTNANDSHVQAGISRPIKVYTPSNLAPFLRIQDFGVGLDAYDIENIYSKYGLSTKTHTNDQTGVLGLGCKSALTYTSQFTIVGVKEGVRTAVSVSRDEEGVGTMTIVDMDDTEEPNGVEIIIPTKTGNTFKQKAEQFFRFWPEGTVLLDDEQPERIKGLEITPEITLLKREPVKDRYGYVSPEYRTPMKSYVVMGKVPYPIDPAQVNFGLPDNYGAVVQIPNGSIHFTPSREALQYTKLTRETLTQVKEDVQAGLLAAINKEINQAPTGPEALKVAIKWRTVLPDALRKTSFKYKTTEIPDSIVAPEDGDRFIVAKGEREKDYYGKNTNVGKSSNMAAIDLTMVPQAIWCYGFKRSFTPTVKKKLWAYCDQQGRGYPTNFILCGTKPSSPWIDASNLVDWSVVEPIKLPRINVATGRNMTGRIPGSYDLFVCSGNGPSHEEDTPADDIDPDTNLYYTTMEFSSASGQATRLSKIEDEFTLAILTTNRVAKFCRLFPQARPVANALQEYRKAFLDTLNGVEREMLLIEVQGYDREFRRSLEVLPQVGIEDPEIIYAQRMINHRPRYRAHLASMYRAAFGGGVEGEWSNPLANDRYPLFETYVPYNDRRAGRRLKRHNLIYINAAYNALHKPQAQEVK